MKNEYFGITVLSIPTFVVELLLQERNFGDTHTQNHLRTYLKF